jgi:hypothetical protein
MTTTRATLPAGVQRWSETLWTFEPGADEAGVLGFRLTHLYTIPYQKGFSTISFLEGAAMPDRPLSGDGSSATIERIERIDSKNNADVHAVRVIGFEAKGWAD